MIRRQLLPAVVVVLAALAVLTGIIYPLAVYGIGQAAFKYRRRRVVHHEQGQGRRVGAHRPELPGPEGQPAPAVLPAPPVRRPAANGYDPAGVTCPPTSTSCGASGATNLGPGDPRLVGFIPGLNTVDKNGNPSKRNVFATPSDP